MKAVITATVTILQYLAFSNRLKSSPYFLTSFVIQRYPFQILIRWIISIYCFKNKNEGGRKGLSSFYLNIKFTFSFMIRLDVWCFFFWFLMFFSQSVLWQWVAPWWVLIFLHTYSYIRYIHLRSIFDVYIIGLVTELPNRTSYPQSKS